MEKRLLKETEAQQYTGLGKSKARTWLHEIGADVHIGRAVRYDRVRIDQVITELGLKKVG